MKKIAGFGLLGLVFGGVFAASVAGIGLVKALIGWGAVLATVAVIYVGLWLIYDD